MQVIQMFPETYTIRARISGSDGQLLSENAYDIDVFAKKDLEAPAKKIAVLDLNNTLTPFFKQAGINWDKFSDSTPVSILVFVTNITSKNEADKCNWSSSSKRAVPLLH